VYRKLHAFSTFPNEHNTIQYDINDVRVCKICLKSSFFAVCEAKVISFVMDRHVTDERLTTDRRQGTMNPGQKTNGHKATRSEDPRATGHRIKA